LIVFVGQDFKHGRVNYRLQIDLFQRASPNHHTQFARLCIGIERHPGLLQDAGLKHLREWHSDNIA
jgi:hypothetical protein